MESARQLKIPEGQTVDPVICIECMSEKKYSTAKDDIGATATILWNEHLFFEPRNVVSILVDDEHGVASARHRTGED